MKPTLVFCLAVLLALSNSGFAKGVTTRITISDRTAGTSVNITDSAVVARFNVWSGRGTFSTIDGRRTEGTQGFIVDWPAGVVGSRPEGLRQYEVRFYVRYPRSSDEQLAYVVLYESALPPTDGFVYFPGNSDEHYRLNVRAIHRGADVEGHWFRASASWQAEIGPLLPTRR
jgi:hypothetical protein